MAGLALVFTLIFPDQLCLVQHTGMRYWKYVGTCWAKGTGEYLGNKYWHEDPRGLDI